MEAKIRKLFPQFSPLQVEAVKLYFADVAAPEYRKNFIENVKTLPIEDKRVQGYYCSYCKRFSLKADAFEHENRAIFPKGENKIWLVNSHYDGCRGWD